MEHNALITKTAWSSGAAELPDEYRREAAQVRIVACVCSNGRGSVGACLGSLLAQSISSAEVTLSVILVDNTQSGDLKAVTPFSASRTAAIYVHEPRPGIPYARNAALRAALQLGADYIAFIDDDEIAPRSWIQVLYSQIMVSEADVVQGSLRRVATLNNALSEAEKYEPALSKVRRRKTAATNNVLFKTWLVTGEQRLEFDEALARVGGSDTEFFMRAQDAGAKIIRATHPPVFEVWNENRDTSGYLSKRAWRCGASTNYRYRKNRHAGMAASILVSRASWRVIGGVAQCLKGVALYPLSRRQGAKALRKGISSLAFAAGCLTPYASIKPKSYY